MAKRQNFRQQSEVKQRFGALENMKQAEIADLFDISKCAVKKDVMRARLHLVRIGKRH